jgi:hypothetical protein
MLRHAREIAGDEQHPRLGVSANVGHLIRGQPRIYSDQDPTGQRDPKVSDEHLSRVECHERDSVARPQPSCLDRPS